MATGASNIGTAVRIGWLSAAIVAMAGYLCVVVPDERRLRAVGFHAHELYDLAGRNERMSAGAAALEAARDRVKADLAALSAQDSSGKVTLAALDLLGREARTYRMSILGFSPESAGGPGGVQDVTISLRGNYANLVKAVGDLSRGSVLLEVTGVTLTQAADPSAARSEVDAAVGARLYYGLQAIVSASKEAARAAAVER